jgi:D-alanine-D-alanine ligase
MARVLLLYNDDGALAHGAAGDAAAVAAVLDAVEGVAAACGRLGHEARRAAAPPDPRELLALLDREGADVVFNLVESVRGETRLEAAVAWLFELAGIAYTGSPPQALSLALDKGLTQAALRGRGVAVPAGIVVARGDEPLEGLRYPVIVKPVHEDASHGISVDSVCHGEPAARRRAHHVLSAYAQPALVEEFVSGREFNVSIVGEGGQAEPLPLREIDYAGFPEHAPRVLSYDAKWSDASEESKGTRGVAARGLAPALEAAIVGNALAAYRILGLRDYGRIDLRLDGSGVPHVLDVNSNPDLSPQAGLAAAAALAGWTYDRLVARILDAALARAAAPSPPRAR